MRPNGFGLIDVRRAQGYGACTALSPERGEILKILSPHSPCLFITGDTMTSLSVQGLEHKGLHGLRDGEGVWGN